MPQDVLRTVRNLITQAAAESNEHAAKNAAIQACRLIRLHGIVLLSAAEAAARQPVTEAIAGAVGEIKREGVSTETAQKIGSFVGAALGEILVGKSGSRRHR